ncbi:LamG domain-containing protein, partial [Opitutales bacterium]|nr:LamG domain-containing protein [Opitutales bacterium]
DWTHVGVVVDYNSSSVKLYQNCELMDEDVIPDDSPVNLLASEAWNIGGSSKISKDFFTGQIDDLRFYNVALSESDINATYLDDLTGTQPAGYENQTLYDEGSAVSGLGIVLEGNQLKAKVAENGSFAEVSSDLNLRDDQWHHAVVSFGDSPRTLKLYLNGAQQGEAAILDYSTVSLHPVAPSFGRTIGTNVYSDFGNYKGQLDNLRIYDRGLVEAEVISIYDGDSPNDGFLEFLAIEKAEVQTLSPVNVLPTQATIRAEILSIGGEVNLAESIVDKSFSIESIPGMQAWYSVQDLDGDNIDDQGDILSNGDQIIQWMDGSGQSRNMAYTSGNPRFYSSALNGKPVISFDGNDMIWGDTNFDFLTNTGYTIVSLARYTGGRNNRVISSRSTNWLFGFHAGLVSRFYANGWISTGGPSDNDWHLHLGTIEAKGGNPAASFWKDGVEMVSGHRGSNNTNFGPGVLQFGGYLNNRERSTCEIAEVMVFEKELNQLDRAKIEGYLAHKWRVNESLLPSTHPYFATNPYGGIEESTVVETVGGDKPILKIFWGDEWIDTNSTTVSDTNNSHWDYVLDINGGNPVSLGIYEESLNGLIFNKTYYYRAYTQNLGGEQWASEVESFTASDTRFTRYTMDGLVLWFDAMDIDGDGARDQFIDGNAVPLWVDKSVSQKNALQTVPTAMPSYAKSVLNSNPGVRFGSGESFNVGSLNLNEGGIHVFMVAQGQGVGVGASSGSIGWTLDVRSTPRFSSYSNEYNVLQQITLGKDPSTGFGQLIGEIGEMMVFDRLLTLNEKEKIEGYLGHKWGIVDDLDGSSFKIKNGLSLYYPFEETSGSKVQDNSPFLNNANLVDGTLGATGKFGSGLEFNNTLDAHLSLENQLALPSNWTASVWFVKDFDDDNTFKYHALLGGGNSAHIALKKSGAKELGSYDEGLFKSVDFGASGLSGNWHHLVGVAAGTNTTFWVDGINVGSIRMNVSSAVESIGNFIGGDGRFSKKIDDFRIYS